MRISFGWRSFAPLLLVGWLGACLAVEAGQIERVPVESSSLVSIGFDRKARALEVEFRSGARYRYLAVPPTVFEEMKKASSKGRYFAQFIRGKYEFQRLKGPAR
jgi:KTSC domain